MKEYNWRKEREKFQPEFNKRPQEEEVVPLVVKKAPNKKIFVVIAVVALLVLAAVMLFKRGDSTRDLSNVAEQYKEAVGLVSCRVELNNGEKIIVPIGTAWAVAPDKFVTNAHVAFGLKESAQNAVAEINAMLLSEVVKNSGAESLDEYVEKVGQEEAQAVMQQIKELAQNSVVGVSGEILVNGSHHDGYAITQYQVHKDYGLMNSSYNPDLAVLTVAEKNPVHFHVADVAELHALKSGDPIAFLGFPMESLANGNVNLSNPIASMQNGIIVAMSDFDLKDAGKSGNCLLRHNLPSAGGASGSPIFAPDGKVVGILFGGNMAGQVVTNGNDVAVMRTPSGAMINFAIRADLLKGMGEPISAVDFFKY